MMGSPNTPTETSEDLITTPEGLRLAVRSWSPGSDARAVIVILHGIAEHCGRYQLFAESLNKLNFAVESFDFHGHGRSDGPRSYVRSFENWLTDVDHLLERVRTRYEKKPVFIFGHSQGGSIALLYAISRKPRIRGLILSAPTVVVNTLVPAFVQNLSFLAAGLLPKLPVLRLDSTALSRDPEIVRDYDRDPLVFRGRLRMRTGAEIFRATRLIRRHMEKIELPMLILHGTDDRIVDVEGSRILHEGVGSRDKTLKLYPGYYHELLNEPGKDVVIHDIEEWLGQHCR